MIDQKAIDELRIDILEGRTGRIKDRMKCAIEYAGIIQAAQWSGEKPDVAALNDAIVIRWSRSGLDWIKNKAWSLATPASRESGEKA